MLALTWFFLVSVGGKIGGQYCANVLVSVFKISSKNVTWVTWERYNCPFVFFPSLSLDYFDVQDLKILLGIISFEIIVVSSQQYGLKCMFCWMLDRI